MRLAEAAKLGFTRCLLPRQNHARLTDHHDLELVPVANLAGALDAL
jgi:predicted ATP-dependent serine protease